MSSPMHPSDAETPLRHGMAEIRIVGRGGDGVVTAGEIVGHAAVEEGHFGQATPAFGPERRGALSSCTLRIDTEPILLRCGPMRPDVLVVLDTTIWRHLPVTAGLADGATLVFNAVVSPEELTPDLRLDAARCRIFCVDATGIALELLGRPIPNTVMVGALAGATGMVAMAALESVIRERFGEKAEANVAAARAGLSRLQGPGG